MLDKVAAIDYYAQKDDRINHKDYILPYHYILVSIIALVLYIDADHYCHDSKKE